MNVKIKDTVVLKNKINIFMDESMNRNRMVRKWKLWTFGAFDPEKVRENQKLKS